MHLIFTIALWAVGISITSLLVIGIFIFGWFFIKWGIKRIFDVQLNNPRW